MGEITVGAVTVHDTTRCLLGEGPLWHPERQQLYWCDILSRRVMTREGGGLRSYAFDRFVSCLGWVDGASLLVATQTDLTLLHLEDGRQERVVELEAGNAATRSNDGRADPWGGFWVGTMGLAGETGAGAIYRVHGGRVVKLFAGLSVPNAICFSPEGDNAYFTDTAKGQVKRCPLDADGWPAAEPETLIDAAGSGPDGAVCDAAGRLWLSHWGLGRVACYAPDGTPLGGIDLPARLVTCPAFGGPELGDLFCTSAIVGLDEAELTRAPLHGVTFRIAGAGRGQAEHRVRL